MTNSAGQTKGGRKLLGQLLVEAGIIDEIQLTVALGAQNDSGLRLGKQLLKLGFVEERDLSLFLKDDTDMGIPLPKRNISKEAISAVPEALAFKHKVVPLASVGKTLVLAISDPTDLKKIDELSFTLGKKIQPVRAFEWEIESALLKFYKHFSEDELEMLTNVSASAEQYQSATWALENEVLLKNPEQDADRPPKDTKTPKKAQARRQPSDKTPPRQQAGGKAYAKGAPEPPVTPQPQSEAATAKKEQDFIFEPTSLTAEEASIQARKASKAISDAAINIKNADILQAIIELLIDKNIITENELIDKMIDLDKNMK